MSTPVDSDAAANAVNENAANGTVVGVTAFASDADATTNAVTYIAGRRCRRAVRHRGGDRRGDRPRRRSTARRSRQPDDHGAGDLGRRLDRRAELHHRASTTSTSSTCRPRSTRCGGQRGQRERRQRHGGRGHRLRPRRRCHHQHRDLLRWSTMPAGCSPIDAGTGVVTTGGGDRPRGGRRQPSTSRCAATSADGSTAEPDLHHRLNDVDEFDVSTPGRQRRRGQCGRRERRQRHGGRGHRLRPRRRRHHQHGHLQLVDDAGGRFAINAATGVVTVPRRRSTAKRWRQPRHHGAGDLGRRLDRRRQSFTIARQRRRRVRRVGARSTAMPRPTRSTRTPPNGTVVGVTAFASDADATTNAITY